MLRPACGTLLLLCLFASHAFAESSAFVNMTAALGSSSAYYGAQVPFDVVVLLSDDVVDSNPASCDPDCRMVTLAVNIALSPPPVSNLELMSAMAVTLRGVPCKLNILIGQFECPYYVAPFPSGTPLTIHGDLSVNGLEDTHGVTDFPLQLTFRAITLALEDAKVTAPAVPLTITGYTPVTYTYESTSMPFTYSSASIHATVISVSVIGMVLSTAVLAVTILFVVFWYDIKGFISGPGSV